MKKIIFLFTFLLNPSIIFSQTLTLVCNGIEKNVYIQSPKYNEQKETTREYIFKDGKLNGQKIVQWSEDKIRYSCDEILGNKCSEIKGSVWIESRDIEISRFSGIVNEIVTLKADRKKIFVSDSISSFDGMCKETKKKF